MIRFDIVHPNYRNQIKGNGTIIRRPIKGDQQEWLQYICCSSTTFTNGIHQFKIKCVKPKGDAIGIITDTSGCKLKKIHWNRIENVDIHYYHGGGGV